MTSLLIRASALQNNQGGTNDDRLAIQGDLNIVESVTLARESLKHPIYILNLFLATGRNLLLLVIEQ